MLAARVHRLARLSLAFFLCGLTTSRVSLLVHEYVGHLGVARLLGATDIEHRLFWFGGGWVSSRLPGGLGTELAVQLAGIVLELLSGAVALGAAARWRRPGLLRFGLCAFGAANLVHGAFYLATGVFEGYGDGRGLSDWLGEGLGRGAFVGAAAALALGGAFVAARVLARTLADELVRGGRMRGALRVSGCLVAAALAHGALTFGEQRLVSDPRYAHIMEKESQRQARLELERLIEESRGRGGPEPTAAELAALERMLAARYARFPLGPVLGAGIVLAALAGLASARLAQAPDAPLPTDLAPLGLACATALGAVILLG
jgi:hypothetical protein